MGSMNWNSSGCLFVYLLSLSSLSLSRARACTGVENNNLVGTLPEELGYSRYLSSSLQFLHIRRNGNLIGSIPSSIGNLSSLRSLDLSSNSLSNSIPSTLTTNKKLQQQLVILDLGHNELTGELPHGMPYSLTKLKEFNVASNIRLHGTIFDYSHAVSGNGEGDGEGDESGVGGGSTNVEILDVSDCSFSGTISYQSLEYFKNLRILNINGNGFSGNLPSSSPTTNATITMKSLTKFTASRNALSGPIPWSWINSNRHLTVLELSNNYFSGTIPSDIGNLEGLDAFRIEGNLLSGTIPTEIGNMSNLTVIDLAFNSIQGMLPDQIGNCSMLQTIDFSRNRFTGTVPTSVGSLLQLKCLDISFNDMQGTLPPHIGNCTSLEKLVVDRNGFHGTVPRELSNLSLLRKYLFSPKSSGVFDIPVSSLRFSLLIISFPFNLKIWRISLRTSLLVTLGSSVTLVHSWNIEHSRTERYSMIVLLPKMTNQVWSVQHRVVTADKGKSFVEDQRLTPTFTSRRIRTTPPPSKIDQNMCANSDVDVNGWRVHGDHVQSRNSLLPNKNMNFDEPIEEKFP